MSAPFASLLVSHRVHTDCCTCVSIPNVVMCVGRGFEELDGTLPIQLPCGHAFHAPCATSRAILKGSVCAEGEGEQKSSSVQMLQHAATGHVKFRLEKF